MHLVCTCVLTDRKKFPQSGYVYITTTNIITMKEKESYQKYKKKSHSQSCVLYIRGAILQTLADILYEPTITMLNEFQSVARRA